LLHGSPHSWIQNRGCFKQLTTLPYLLKVWGKLGYIITLVTMNSESHIRMDCNMTLTEYKHNVFKSMLNWKEWFFLGFWLSIFGMFTISDKLTPQFTSNMFLYLSSYFADSLTKGLGLFWVLRASKPCRSDVYLQMELFFLGWLPSLFLD
jgi:hypothetical protein